MATSWSTPRLAQRSILVISEITSFPKMVYSANDKLLVILEIAGSSSEDYYAVNQSIYIWGEGKTRAGPVGDHHKVDVGKIFRPIEDMTAAQKLKVFEWIFK